MCMKKENLMEAIENEVGEILLFTEEVPGAYFITAKNEEQRSNSEYYIIELSSSAISASAKSYGRPFQSNKEILLYDIEDVSAGQKIVAFEIARYKLKNGSGDIEKSDLADIASAGMETNPEYFGSFPAPIKTPWGDTLRYKKLSKGI